MNGFHERHINYAPSTDTQSGGLLDEIYLRNKFPEDITTHNEFPADCLEYHQAILAEAKKQHWTDNDYDHFWLSEAVAIESLSWKRSKVQDVRFDKASWLSHALFVALKNIQLGLSPSTVIEAPMHDSIEDTLEYPQGPQITQEAIARLFDAYDPSIAISIGLETKKKVAFSGKNLTKRNEPHETHFRLYAIVAHKAESACTKLHDRLHWLMTAGSMPLEKRREKDRETLDYYVPLAVGLGLHDLAQELSTLSIGLEKTGKTEPVSLPFSDDAYDEAIIALSRATEEFRTKNNANIPGVFARRPNINDAHTMTHGKLDMLADAHLPAFVNIVLGDGNGRGSGQSDEAFFSIARPLMLEFWDKNLIMESEYMDFLRRVRTGVRRTMHVEIYVAGVPVRLRFSTQTDELEWEASVLDTVPRREVLDQKRRAAEKKIDRLKRIYQYYLDQHMGTKKFLTNIRECLVRRTIDVVVVDGQGQRAVVLPANATAFDMALIDIPDDKDGFIGVIRREIEKDVWEIVDPKAELENNGIYSIELSKNKTITASTLDAVQTEYGKDQVQKLLRERLRAGEETITEGVIDRGVRIVVELYKKYAQEKRNKDSELLADVYLVKRLIKKLVKEKAYSRHIMKGDFRLNFLLRVGIGDLPVDTARTSIVWRVVRHLYKHQNARRSFSVSLSDRPGALHAVTGALKKKKVNIASLIPRPDYRLSTTSSHGTPKVQAQIKVTKVDLDRFMEKEKVKRKKQKTRK